MHNFARLKALTHDLDGSNPAPPDSCRRTAADLKRPHRHGAAIVKTTENFEARSH